MTTLDARGTGRIAGCVKAIVKSSGERIVSIKLEKLMASAGFGSKATLTDAAKTWWTRRPATVFLLKPCVAMPLAGLSRPIAAAAIEGAVNPFAWSRNIDRLGHLQYGSVGKSEATARRTQVGVTAAELEDKR